MLVDRDGGTFKERPTTRSFFFVTCAIKRYMGGMLMIKNFLSLQDFS